MDFRSLKDLLLSRALPDGFKSRLKEAEAVSRWETAVGPTIAKYAQAIRVDAGVLYIEVGHPIWRSELHHRRRQILEILNAGAPDEQAILKDLYFLDPKNPYRNEKIKHEKKTQNNSGTLEKKSESPLSSSTDRDGREPEGK